MPAHADAVPTFLSNIQYVCLLGLTLHICLKVGFAINPSCIAAVFYLQHIMFSADIDMMPDPPKSAKHTPSC